MNMRSGTVGVTVFLALAAPFIPGRARACDFSTGFPHTIDSAQVGVDQTPPQLGQPTVAELYRNESGDGCVNQKCGFDHGARLTNLATDDMTPVEKMGYRVTVLAGGATGPSAGPSPALGNPDGTLTLFWDGDDDFDYTIQLVAIDAAGNESAPATVHLSSGSGGCSVGRRRASQGFGLALVALALAGARARRRRRR